MTNSGTNKVIVITGTTKEFEDWCKENGRDRNTAIQVTDPIQLKFYRGLEIVKYGRYWLNNCYHSPELREIEIQKAIDESKNL